MDTIGKYSDAEKKQLSELAIAVLGKQVESYDLQTGNTIKQYPAVRSTKSDGFSPGSVVDVAKDKRKSHKGLGWRYTYA